MRAAPHRAAGLRRRARSVSKQPTHYVGGRGGAVNRRPKVAPPFDAPVPPRAPPPLGWPGGTAGAQGSCARRRRCTPPSEQRGGHGQQPAAGGELRDRTRTSEDLLESLAKRLLAASGRGEAAPRGGRPPLREDAGQLARPLFLHFARCLFTVLLAFAHCFAHFLIRRWTWRSIRCGERWSFLRGLLVVSLSLSLSLSLFLSRSKSSPHPSLSLSLSLYLSLFPGAPTWRGSAAVQPRSVAPCLINFILSLMSFLRGLFSQDSFFVCVAGKSIMDQVRVFCN